MPPLAYFITFSTYGSHLQGDPRGWVCRENNIRGMPLEPANSLIFEHAQRQCVSPYILNTEQQRQIVLDSLIETCRFRSWQLIAAHIRPEHIHCLLKAEYPPEIVLCSIKANASRLLKAYHKTQNESIPAKFWAVHGSTRYVWDAKDLEPITHYIYHEQGTPMARFCLNPDWYDAPRNTHGWEK